jgi:hypothetical protein
MRDEILQLARLRNELVTPRAESASRNHSDAFAALYGSCREFIKGQIIIRWNHGYFG